MALVNERVRILENECVGPNLYLMTLSSPAIAAAIEPGQFVHMKIPGMEGHVLRRPFSVYAADAAGGTLDVLYQTVGFGTNHLAALAPDVANEIDSAELIGPVGRRWQAPAGTQRALLVGGGVGAAPLFMLCQELVGSGATSSSCPAMCAWQPTMARSAVRASAPPWCRRRLPQASTARRISMWRAVAPSPL